MFNREFYTAWYDTQPLIMISYIYDVTKVQVDGYYDISSSTYNRYVFFRDDDGTNQRMILSSIDEIEISGEIGETLNFESVSQIFVEWDDLMPNDLEFYEES